MKPRAVISLLVILAMVAPPGVLGILAGLSGETRTPTRERDIELARMQLRQVAAALQHVFTERGGYPTTLAALTPEPVFDPWGAPLWYCVAEDDAVRLRSSGPDQKPGTRDDVFLGRTTFETRALTCERAQGPRPPMADPPRDRWAEVRKQVLRGTRSLRGLFS